MSSRAIKKPPKPKPSFKSSGKEDIPLPFQKAPRTLAAFLDRLDPSKVYITHIDRFPIEAKKQVYAVPVILNTAIALLLAWRLYAALPLYWTLLETVLGYSTAARMDTADASRSEQLNVLFRRFAMFAIDFVLVRFVGPWPLTFFLEQPANPVLWRWKLGFRGREVVARVSRGWGTEELMQGVKRGEENAFFKTRVLPAIEKGFMQKTGYLMMDKSWDLDFELMLDAHTLAERQAVRFEDVDGVVLAHVEGTGWAVWQWEGPSDAVETRRRKIVDFKEALTAAGKESLFWKWTEIVEEERQADGGFSPEQQEKVVERVQAEFEREGVDFNKIAESIGGLEDMPAKKE
ncbi:hypothetical protein MBLNU230_g3406t1 [Neophaeotheca triangularis]